MSSDESDDNDEDYVPSENGSFHSEDASDDDEADFQPKRHSQDTDQNTERTGAREKTEDELWNEFLGGTADQKETAPEKEEVPKSDSKPSVDQALVKNSPCSTPSSSVFANTSTEASDIFADDNNISNDADISRDNMEGKNEPGEAKLQSGQLPKNTAQAGASAKSGGVTSLLDRIAKDKKQTTLEKSRQDWDGYKAKEGITEELSTHNRGKGGYLDRKEFLERSDIRQFEKERDIRLSRKRKSPLD